MANIWPEPIEGRLYAVQFQDGAVKIGYTTNMAQRLNCLQARYRGAPSRIDRVYIGELTADAAQAEYMATFDLARIERREIYKVSFAQAVRKIKKVVPDKTPMVLYSRDEVLHEFPFLRKKEFDH